MTSSLLLSFLGQKNFSFLRTRTRTATLPIFDYNCHFLSTSQHTDSHSALTANYLLPLLYLSVQHDGRLVTPPYYLMWPDYIGPRLKFPTFRRTAFVPKVFILFSRTCWQRAVALKASFVAFYAGGLRTSVVLGQSTITAQCMPRCLTNDYPLVIFADSVNSFIPFSDDIEHILFPNTSTP